MALLLVVVFLVAPLVELAVIISVADSIGVFNTIGLLILVSLVGAWLARREGAGVLQRIQGALSRGEMPSNEVADGGLILLAGALMIAPGFVSDVLAILLLLPPTRAVVRVPLLRYAARKGLFAVGVPGSRGGAGRRRAGRVDVDVWDVESWEDTPRSQPRGQLGDTQ